MRRFKLVSVDIPFGLCFVIFAALSKLFENVDTPMWKFENATEIQNYGWIIGKEIAILFAFIFIFFEVSSQKSRGAWWLMFVLFQVINVFTAVFDSNKLTWLTAFVLWGCGVIILIWKSKKSS